MIRFLHLMSSMRSGSHMIRSMLRSDPIVLDVVGEHGTVCEAELTAPKLEGRTLLVPQKFDLSVSDCLTANEVPDSCALVLHRRDWLARAASETFARRNHAWFGGGTRERIEVDWGTAEKTEMLIESRLEQLRRELVIPHVVMAYEDITEQSVGEALEHLLGRPVKLSAPETERLGSLSYVDNLP